MRPLPEAAAEDGDLRRVSLPFDPLMPASFGRRPSQIAQLRFLNSRGWFSAVWRAAALRHQARHNRAAREANVET